ncbi:MAG: GAP family protein [Solirubrobacteraceae bacterium]
MASVDTELVLVALGAMLSPTTLSFSVLALVLGEHPLRTGLWFYLGALGITLLIGVLAAFVLGDVAAPPSGSSTPKTWVCVVDVLAGVALLVVVVRFLRRPSDPARMEGMIERMSRLASSPAIAIVAAGATLANPGGFIPLALKDISQMGPTAAGYVAEWVGFALISLLPLSLALAMLAIAPEWTGKLLTGARGWLERHAMTLAAAILALLAVALLRNGIVGLTG